MELKIDLSELENIRKKIGVTLKEFKPKNPKELIRDLEEADIKIRLKKGIEISFSDIEMVGPFPTYKEFQVILYIKNTGDTLYKVQNEKHTARKYHVYWCKVLENITKEGNFKNKFVKTRKTDGKFKVDVWKDKTKKKRIESEEKLYVCQFCLEKIDYEGFSDLDYSEDQKQRREIVEQFNIEKFLDEYEGIVRYLALPQGTDKTEPLSTYDAEFVKRSRRVKEDANYHCEECNVFLKNARRLLHCHHKNHKKHDNSWKNLSAICALCHRDNHHKKMHIPKDYEQKIKKLRKEQGIPVPPTRPYYQK